MQACKAFYDTERRNVYTTPKTFLELIKLYKSTLARKRKESQDAIDRWALIISQALCQVVVAALLQSLVGRLAGVRIPQAHERMNAFFMQAGEWSQQAAQDPE
jgi:hypothetical protein